MTNAFETMNTEATNTTEVTGTDTPSTPISAKVKKLADIDRKIKYHEDQVVKLGNKKDAAVRDFNQKITKSMNILEKLKDDRKRVEAEEDLTLSQKMTKVHAARKAKLDAIRNKQANGETLTPEEQETLDKATKATEERVAGAARARAARSAKVAAIKAKINNGEPLNPVEYEFVFKNLK